MHWGGDSEVFTVLPVPALNLPVRAVQVNVVGGDAIVIRLMCDFWAPILLTE